MAITITSLTDFKQGLGTTKQLRADSNDNVLNQVIAGVSGSRIKLHRLFMSVDEACVLTIYSGTTALFAFNVGDTWGALPLVDSKSPLFVCESGEAFSIQCSAAKSYNLYIQYVVEQDEN